MKHNGWHWMRASNTIVSNCRVRKQRQWNRGEKGEVAGFYEV